MKILLFFLFIVGSLFLNASHVPAWVLGASKPAHARWKLYAAIGVSFYIVILILANTLL